MDETAAALIGALFGAGGAVAAQIVAVVAAGRREERQSIREKEVRLLAERREAFARYLGACEEALHRALNNAPGEGPGSVPRPRFDTLRATNIAKMEFVVLVPELTDLAQKVLTALVMLEDTSGEASGKHLDDYIESREELIRGMQQNLGTLDR